MGDHRLLHDFSTQELLKEIERRQKEPPKRLQFTEWVKVSAYVDSVVSGIARGDDLPKDFEYTLMTLTLEAMYGQSIWQWWKSKLKNQ